MQLKIVQIPIKRLHVFSFVFVEEQLSFCMPLGLSVSVDLLVTRACKYVSLLFCGKFKVGNALSFSVFLLASVHTQKDGKVHFNQSGIKRFEACL